jgi:hypothetical protein
MAPTARKASSHAISAVPMIGGFDCVMVASPEPPPCRRDEFALPY